MPAGEANARAQGPSSKQAKDERIVREPFINKIRKIFFRFFRTRRMQRFLNSVQPQARDRILDVGGYPGFWNDAPFLEDITILNVDRIEGAYPARFHIVSGDGAALQFADGEFDLAHSNSVIEHVGDFARQQAFASELRRVGRKLWVQTPARHFLVEPHYIDIFCHWFPKNIQRRLLRYFSVWGLVHRPSQTEIDAMVAEIRLLNRAEMQALFPDCRIETERVLGWTKAYIAIRD
jgi:hypothetical protein